jgi:hypothetical protein
MIEPIELGKQKSITKNKQSATGMKKSEDSQRNSLKKQTTFKVQVSKIEIGAYYSGDERTKCPHEIMLTYDAEEGFTVIGKPQDAAFIQQVKETLLTRQEKDPEHFKRVLIAQDPEEPKVFCLVVQHENRYKERQHVSEAN